MTGRRRWIRVTRNRLESHLIAIRMSVYPRSIVRRSRRALGIGAFCVCQIVLGMMTQLLWLSARRLSSSLRSTVRTDYSSSFSLGSSVRVVDVAKQKTQCHPSMLHRETSLESPINFRRTYHVRVRSCGSRDRIQLRSLPKTVHSGAQSNDARKGGIGKEIVLRPTTVGRQQNELRTCHIPSKAYGDGLAVSPGAGGNPLRRNTQTCLNVGFLRSLFWDGRAASLEERRSVPSSQPRR